MSNYSCRATAYSKTGLCLLFCLSGCMDKAPSYFPLETGFSWQYKAVMATMDTTVKYKHILENMPKKSIAGEAAYIQQTLSGDEYVYGEDESGVFQLGYIRGGDAERMFVPKKRYVFHYPLTPGSSWQGRVTTMALRNSGPRGVVITEDVPVQVKLTAINDKVRVAAGTFRHCLRIERTGETIIPEGKYQYIQKTKLTVKDTEWYAPGVGLVKSVRTETTQSRLLDHGEYRMELYSFSRK